MHSVAFYSPGSVFFVCGSESYDVFEKPVIKCCKSLSCRRYTFALILYTIIFWALCCVNQEEHLGIGTKTNIYSGTLKVKGEEEEDAGYTSFQEVKVVLKVLGSGHRDISMVSS